MNIQNKINRLQTNLTQIEALLDKEVWTTEETRSYGNKKMLSVERDLVEASIQLYVIEFYLDKPLNDWTDFEKEKYGSKEQLRKREEQIREERNILLRIKENTIARGMQGKTIFLP